MAGWASAAGGEIEPLCDPSRYDLETAVSMAKVAAANDPYLDVKLARYLAENSNLGASNPSTAMRILDLLSALGVRARLQPFLVQVFRNPHPKVMSKLALILGRAGTAKNFFDKMLATPDPRVHANLVEAVWGMNTPECRALLWRTARAPNNRTAANAAIGLYLLGEKEAAAMLHEMAHSAAAEFRASAAWAMGKLGDASFHRSLAALISDLDSTVRRNALRSLVQLRKAAARSKSAEHAGTEVPAAG